SGCRLFEEIVAAIVRAPAHARADGDGALARSRRRVLCRIEAVPHHPAVAKLPLGRRLVAVADDGEVAEEVDDLLSLGLVELDLQIRPLVLAVELAVKRHRAVAQRDDGN